MSRSVATVRALVLVAAFTVFATTLHSAPPDPQVEPLYRQGRAALDTYLNDPDDRSHGQLEEALSALESLNQLHKKHPKNVWILETRASLHHQQHHYEKAISDYSKIIELDPGCANAYFERAMSRFGQVNRIRKVHKKPAITDKNTDRIVVQKNRPLFPGVSRMDFSKLTETSNDLCVVKIETVATATASGIVAEGHSYTELVPELSTFDIADRLKYQEACADIDKAIELNPDNYEYYLVRAQTYSTHNQMRAIANLDRVIEIKPDCHVAYISRAYYHRRQNNMDAALADCNKAIELDPENKHYYSERVVVHTLRGEHEKADADFKRAYQTGRKSSTVR